MLERWLTERPALEGVSAVVFDEFHERSLSGDLSLGRVKHTMKHGVKQVVKHPRQWFRRQRFRRQ